MLHVSRIELHRYCVCATRSTPIARVYIAHVVNPYPNDVLLGEKMRLFLVNSLEMLFTVQFSGCACADLGHMFIPHERQ